MEGEKDNNKPSIEVQKECEADYLSVVARGYGCVRSGLTFAEAAGQLGAQAKVEVQKLANEQSTID